MKRVKKENDPQIRDDNTSMVDLPRDLIEKILLNLPAISIPKLIVVSKLWSSIIRSKSFIDLYLKRSLTRPCFLITFNRDDIRFFHSIPMQSLEAASPSSSYTCTTSSFPLSLDTKRLCSKSYNVSPPVRGLICFQYLDKVVVSNPSTGQFLVLPKLRKLDISRFLGYDPVGDEYKVLCTTVMVLQDSGEVVSEEHQVFTLKGGSQKKEKEEATWRMIECKVPHCPVTKGICMTTTTNGVIYYGALSTRDRDTRESLIVCFDVRSEGFTLVKLPNGVEIDGGDESAELVNYQGKIALLNHLHFGKCDMWVLEDVGKPEWSKISIVVPSWAHLARGGLLDCRGAILSSGEFIFSPVSSDSPFCIVTYDREKDIGSRTKSVLFRSRMVSSSMVLVLIEVQVFSFFFFCRTKSVSYLVIHWRKPGCVFM
ncbi:PREDICTED: putative F-box protein At3g10790 [Camelina sativa]|uniref:F-box protein At3g10790 n=1 Tax=Camelina sativa TaxID=90675 RepID=A0ABM0XW94_CAMSA|nr:PREDICTED: putative F-box protein At3g10790 [Camelina sativa]